MENTWACLSSLQSDLVTIAVLSGTELLLVMKIILNYDWLTHLKLSFSFDQAQQGDTMGSGAARGCGDQVWSSGGQHGGGGAGEH